jgi:hypothetical protein
MTPLFKKLNFKDQKEVFIINHPTEFDAELEAMKSFSAIKTNIEEATNIEFILIFVKTKAEVEQIVPSIIKELKTDAVLWFAYPKGTSKKYKVEIGRDNGWDILGKYDFETVRAVAIDEDWSTLRFRNVAFVKSMARNQKLAMTNEGKSRTEKNEI